MLLRFPDLNPDWLINGKGDIYRSNTHELQDLITNVNDSLITDVNEPKPKQQAMDIPDVNVSENNKTRSLEALKGIPELEVTNVNTAQAGSPVETTKKLNENLRREIDRVILFFSDGSFEEYRK